MDKIRPIRTEEDYAAALARIEELMDAEPGTPEADELDVLADLVEHYEAKTIPLGFPTPVAAIEFRMEQAGLKPRDLIPYIGSRAKVSEVLSGKRQLTLPMAIALHEHLGIPSEVLLKNPSVVSTKPLSNTEWDKYPLRAMAKGGWIPNVPNLAARAEEFMQGLIAKAGGADVAAAVLYRKNDHVRQNAKTDQYALRVWCWKVLADASETRLGVTYVPGTVTPEFLHKVAQLSWLDDGPRLAKEVLAKHGIPLVIVPHLPKTYLDGAALKLADGTPVVGLTLRYDRLDNFWFCLLHELAHIGLHMEGDGEATFIDDLTLRGAAGGRFDPQEEQADKWAEEALVPHAVWESSEARFSPTPMAVISLAKALQVHPAIVAGKIRHDLRNYRLLSHFVGTGEVQRHFRPVSETPVGSPKSGARTK